MAAGITILIVEDDPAVLEMLQLLFDDEGHRTLIAADGRIALQLAAQEPSVPDLIVADFNLPKGLNGLETIAKLQEQVRHTIPAIILTGDISTESLREISSHGCLHLNKPVRAKELTRLAQHLLARRAPIAPNGVQQSPLHPESGASSTVFVVDDDRAVRETMRDLLQENGYAVEIFAGGSDFCAAYRPGRKGRLLVDALMPGMSGIELIYVEPSWDKGEEIPPLLFWRKRNGAAFGYIRDGELFDAKWVYIATPQGPHIFQKSARQLRTQQNNWTSLGRATLASLLASARCRGSRRGDASRLI